MKVLIDGDIVAYRCSSSAENDPDWVATSRINGLLNTIIYETKAEDYQVYISGQENFRKTLSPAYKANRAEKKPKWLEICREFLVVEWNAKITDQIEADDAIAIQSVDNQNGTICASLDKDFRQIPGQHYRWAFSGTTHGKQWSKPAESFVVSETDGLRFFYKQLLIGDEADNIKGIYGIGKVKASNLIDHLNTEQEMFQTVRTIYNDDERLLLNGKLLWILREEGKVWEFPKEQEEPTQKSEQEVN